MTTKPATTAERSALHRAAAKAGQTAVNGYIRSKDVARFEKMLVASMAEREAGKGADE